MYGVGSLNQVTDLEAIATQAINEGVRNLVFDGSPSSIKRDGSLVTEYDTRVEKEVTAIIARLDPDAFVISEESAKDNIYVIPDGFNGWILDPIDGTTNFAAGFPVFSISLGYCREGVVIFGAIWDSITRCVYSSPTMAIHEYSNNLNESRAASDFEGDRLANEWGINVFTMLASSTRSTRVIGSVALGMLWTALGRFDVYCAPAPKIWDFAAGEAMIRASGGSFIHQHLGIDRPSLVCGSPELVDEIVSRLQISAHERN